MELNYPKIVCVGSNIESKIVLKRFIDNKIKISGLVSLPLESAENVSDFADITELAKREEIEVIITKDINCTKTLEKIRNLKPDFIFVLGWSQIFKKDLLSIPKSFVVGSHPSPLPLRKGRAPLPWAILGGYKENAVTLFEMSTKIDEGKILIQKFYKIPDDINVTKLYEINSKKLAESFHELYKNIVNGSITYKKSINNKEESFRGKRIPEDGFLEFNHSAKYLHNLISAITHPYPGSYFYYGKNIIHCFSSNPYSGPERVGVIGQIVGKTKSGIIVYTNEGCIELQELFMNGKPVGTNIFTTGEVLNYRLHDQIYSLKKQIDYLESKIIAMEDK